jgi:hypothetical protein
MQGLGLNLMGLVGSSRTRTAIHASRSTGVINDDTSKMRIQNQILQKQMASTKSNFGESMLVQKLRNGSLDNLESND